MADRAGKAAGQSSTVAEVQGSVKDPRTERTRLFGIAIVAAVAALAVAIVVGIVRRRRLEAARRARPILPAVPPLPVEGLTEAEALARREEGQDNAIYIRPSRSRQQIWQENVYNIFNLNLVGLAIAQLLLGRPLDALLSLGTIGLNIGLNVGQEVLARRRLQQLEQAGRPQATVIRENKTRSIDPSEIVLGDALVLGPGDLILVDGVVVGDSQIVVDESEPTNRTGWQTKGNGDPLFAGSFCISGRAACQVGKVGDQRLIETRTAQTKRSKPDLTPVERTIQQILRALLVIVLIFVTILLVRYFRLDTGIAGWEEIEQMFNEAASVIFNIAPSSLFFMIVVTYAMGTLDLAKLGALVHQARSVELLAEATVLCFAKAGILTGTQVEILPLDSTEYHESFAESRLRQILGDYARTLSVNNLATRILADTFEGSRRQAVQEAPFLSAYGWSAITFDDDDLRGVFVLGDSELLAGHLDRDEAESEDEGERGSPLAAVQRLTRPLGRLFGRNGDEDQVGSQDLSGLLSPAATGSSLASEAGPSRVQDAGSAELGTSEVEDPPVQVNGIVSEEKDLPETAGKPGLLRRLTGRLGRSAPLDNVPDASVADKGKQPSVFQRMSRSFGRLLGRSEPQPEIKDTKEDSISQVAVLTFAYCPDLVDIYDPAGVPRLPQPLMPLCSMSYTQRVRPEAIDTIRAFARTGVSIKVFTSGPAANTVDMLLQAGLRPAEIPLDTISGEDVSAMKDGELARAAVEHTVFGQVSPEQTGQIVAALRQSGEPVAVIGDGVRDLPAMRQATVAITRQSSTQAALSTADIVLLEGSPEVLSVVLEKGQRIANGLIDVLRLNLTQVCYLALLIMSIGFFLFGFPYRSQQGAIVAIATVALPSAGLSLWAASGVLPRARIGRILSWVVLPAAVAIAAAGFYVYAYFLDRSGEMAYAQLTLTYTLVACGLLLVVLIRPPWRTRWALARSGARAGDPKPAIVALVVMVLFLIVSAIPLAQELLKLGALRELKDYAFIGLVALVASFTLAVFWRVFPLERMPGRQS